MVLSVGTTWAAVGDTFTNNGLKYKVTSESQKAVQLTGYTTEPTGALVIPATVNSYDVISIGKGALSYCVDITSVEIPASVTSIGANAFYDCESLESIIIPDGVTSIGNSTFSSCLSLKSVYIPDGVTSIGREAFLDCESLTEINLPGSIRSIGNNAFESCDELKTVNIYAPSLSSYGTNTFKDAGSSLEINVFSEYADAYKTGWKDYSGKIEEYSAEELTVTGVTANQNPGETSEYWVTYYHPAANTKITSDDAEIYIAILAEENGYVNLTQVEGNIIKAGQAVMLKAASADALAMELTPDAATGNYSGNSLKGGSTVATDKVAYTLAAKNGRMGFYKFAGSALNPNKAHLELPSLSASVHEFIALDEETVTSINVNVNDNDNPNDDAWYDLNGSRVQKFKGSSINGKPSTVNGKPRIYIHNGRKEVVR